MTYRATVESWASPEEIDWQAIHGALADYLKGVIQTFSDKNPESVVYGLVIERGQNWELSVYLNSEEGYTTMPGRFRPLMRNTPEKTDEEILSSLGRWYFEVWEFANYEFNCDRDITETNHAHYDLFERLSEDDSVDLENWQTSF